MSYKCRYMSLAVSTVLLVGSVASADIVSTIENATPGTTVQASGTYTVATKITVPTGVTVKGPATFVFTKTDADGFVINATVSNAVLQSLEVTGAKRGIVVYGVGNQVTSCSSHNNHDRGMLVAGTSAKNNTISGCTSYNNVDSNSGGGNADGITFLNGTSTGNQVITCTFYSNSDDGYDCYGAASPVAFSGCEAYGNGSYGGGVGNGVGFKMGGHAYTVAHTYTSCVAHDNIAGTTHCGFNVNGNAGQIVLNTCHSYSNGKADVLGNCILINCTMQH